MGYLAKRLALASGALLIWTGSASAQQINVTPANLGDILTWTEPLAAGRMLANISRADGKPGAVIASPNRTAPNYYFHWVRDGALTMLSVEGLEARLPLGSPDRQRLRSTLLDYAGFSDSTQTLALAVGIPAQTRFQVDGSIASDGWATPQMDGPALRAISLMVLAERLLDEGQDQLVLSRLYRPDFPASTVIKRDLEFVAHHWSEAGYDVWEESFGVHFYDLMVERRAMVEGSRLADRLGDHEAAGFYRQSADQIGQSLARFYDANRGYIVATLDQRSGPSYKAANLDSVVLLAFLHGATDDGFMNPTDAHVLQTVARLESAFAAIYPINSGKAVPAIGRYPEDRYDGANASSIGNPWFLTTFAMAEMYAKLAVEFSHASSIAMTPETTAFFQALCGGWVSNPRTVAQKALERSQMYMASALGHMAQDTAMMSEQFDRGTGYMRGAQDLTWSYAAFFTADWALARAKASVGRGY